MTKERFAPEPHAPEYYEWEDEQNEEDPEPETDEN